MARCPDGHDSTSDDYCDVCGMLIAGPSPAPAAGNGTAPAGAAPVGGGADTCPACGTPKSGGVFCEGCGYNFSTAQPQVTPDPVPAPVPAPAVVIPSAPAAAPAVTVTGWSVVVAADRTYYDAMEADSGPDGSGIPFPAYCPERRFQLAGEQMQIGRRSPSRGLEPEIDLTGPPTDPGISRLHAVLMATPDGWAVLDPGSSNGTQLNGTELINGVQAPLHDGDRITLGAWTAITVHTT